MSETKPIPGLPGYEVTREGRVKTPTGRWAKLADNGNGYLYFSVQRRFGPNRRRAVHVAVCSAWNGPKPEPKWEVRHLDGNRRHNEADNLKWGTRAENRADSRKLGHPAARGKLTRADAEEIRHLFATGDLSKAELGRRYGVTRTHIGFIVNNEVWRGPM